ncbi:hypothetical protein EIP91_007988 [Steccherinum ochraceum]|uniref:Arrestin-like N-terminal domain-containing protein n=1 Tax=Steccherinum ochraceum TaxID=92696 RepID=A0A4R0RBP0_9APHY|nr:hypothetical protein EIP91_007988 [Steccherinum ochraceum]
MSLKLNVPPTICVGGQIISGEAELHFPQVVQDELEEVHVKLRGTVHTRISRQIGNQRVVRREFQVIIAENSSLWTRSSTYPPADDAILRIPFKFTLPTNAPSSCSYDSFGRSGQVGYFIELVGVRSGMLARNRRARIPIPVVPLDLEGDRIAVALRSPEPQFALYVSTVEKNIRRGFFGERAHTRMEISFPNTHMYPLFTPIPYTLRVTTISKPMKKDEADRKPNKPIFPSPPTKPTDVQFHLVRQIWLKAQWFTATGEESVTALGGMQTVASAVESGQPVDVQVRDRDWIPSETDKNTGTWLQETTFSSAFVLTCPPTFSMELIRLKYALQFTVPFPGVGNNLSASIPIQVSSGLSSAPPSYVPGTSSVPPPALDLPPAYWGSADSWDDHEKSTTPNQPKPITMAPSPVNLRMPSGVFVGGQPICGEAELHFPDILEDDIEEVHVKLRGYIHVNITKRIPARNGRPSEVRPHHDTIPLIKENISVWSRMQSPSPSGSQMILVPFQFVLPMNVLPSIDWTHGHDIRGSVSYFIEIVGTREGALHRNRRVRVAFPVLPPDYQGAMINKNLRAHVPYPTRTTDVHKEMRRGIFGGYANATAQLVLPDFPSYPLFTPIPYILRIVTVTKPQKYKAEDQSSSEPMFPAPPTNPSEIDWRVNRHVYIRTGIHSEGREDHYQDLGGMGKGSTGQGVNVHVNERRWMPTESDDHDHAGSWLQETTMQGVFVVTFPPGFETEHMRLRYDMTLKIDFPGMGNDLKTDIPLVVSSGLPFMPDDYVYPGPNGPPPAYPHQGYQQTLDLPKSYWELQDWADD